MSQQVRPFIRDLLGMLVYGPKFYEAHKADFIDLLDMNDKILQTIFTSAEARLPSFRDKPSPWNDLFDKFQAKWRVFNQQAQLEVKPEVSDQYLDTISELSPLPHSLAKTLMFNMFPSPNSAPCD